MASEAIVELLNTLYVTTQRAYLHLDHDTVRVEVERATTLRVPLLHLEALVCFGDVLISPALLHRCGDDGRAVILLDRNGRFKGRLVGSTGGNVLLRRAQHLALSDAGRTALISRCFAAGKIGNCRQVLMRAAREATKGEDAVSLRSAADALASSLDHLRESKDVEQIRGCEGGAAQAYFDAFDCMVRVNRDTFSLRVRTRRPPRDPLNATLSFLYALVLNDCASALESVGLDPQVGYLHALRPGKPSLALDLIEELRPAIADRLALTLINRRQLLARDFEEHPGGGVLLGEQGRRRVVTEYQRRKGEEVRHRVLDRMIPVGLIPHTQARLLARHLRGDLEYYPPFVLR